MKRKTTYLILVAALAGAFAVPTGRAGSEVASRTALLNSTPRHLSTLTWWGGRYAVPDGEHLSLHISTSYPEAEALAQQWVSFFSDIPHGQELSLAQVYIAPLDQVEEMCFNADVLGCYGGQTLVTVGESTDGITPASIAAHEYGHHIAANRSNAPWKALDWGTKRWASTMGICSRVTTGMAFPGDEGANYSLNPGEAFAESYRVLVETYGSAVGYDWPIVDPSFMPSPDSLAAIREDVLHPWSGPSTTTVRGRFARNLRTWSTQLTTPLDGDLRVQVNGTDDLTLLSSDGRTVLARGSWTSSGGKAVEYRVCGTRSVRVRVTRGGPVSRFTLEVRAP